MNAREQLTHCALCEDPSFIYRDCALAAATRMRDLCVENVKAMRDVWESKRNQQEPLSKMRNRYDAALCAGNEIITGKPLEYIEVPDCFKHRLEGETPWHTCWANNVRMAERALEAAANETKGEDGDDAKRR